MEATLGLLGTCGGGGGGGGGAVSGSSFGGSTAGSMSTLSKEDKLVLSSEVSSSYPDDESELQLGLGLSLGVGGGGFSMAKPAPAQAPAPHDSVSWCQNSRILTAKDFPFLVSNTCSSSSSSSATKANVSAGTKRAADSVSPTANAVSNQVVGWPPIRAYRINSLVNQVKSPPPEESNSTVETSKSKDALVGNSANGREKNMGESKEKRHFKTSLFVKVNMDGILIGRKVDLTAHGCYETLAQKLEGMFCKPTASIGARRSNLEEHDLMIEARGTSKLLGGSSEFVLTYKDKDGDWMLVGDVPWGMFLSSVKRLRIMRTSEAKGLAPRCQENNRRQRSKPI